MKKIYLITIYYDSYNPHVIISHGDKIVNIKIFSMSLVNLLT